MFEGNMNADEKIGELPKKGSSSKKFLRIGIQVGIMIALFAALFWYVFSASSEGDVTFISVLSNIKVEFVILAFLSYFGINILFTVRLRRVLKREGIKTSFGKTLLAQYAGMLTSDVTPARSGYILTPVYLRDQDVPAPVSLSGILGIQSVEFLIKVLGGVLALVFVINFAVVPLTQELLILAIAGVGLMAIGGIVLAAMSWSQRVIGIVQKITNHRLLKRFTGGLMGKLEEYAVNAKKTRKAFPEIIGLTFGCWILKGFEWLFLGLALGITLNGNLAIAYLGFFLIHPLVTALGFVPTPAGMGAQEWGVVIILGLFAVDPITAFSFALLARGLLVIEDLVGVPQIVKTSSLLLSRKKSSAEISPAPPTV
jgi:glycosyltransferase 2 family protein